MTEHHQHSRGHGHGYLPAMGSDRLIRIYDPFTFLLGIPRAHRRLADQADVRPGARVLEIGTGTGNLALLVARRTPDAEVAGIDPDPLALRIARGKSARRGLEVRWDRGSATELPYPDESVDRVLSSLMFHHLGADEKAKTLSEVHRVLKPGGRLHLMDFTGQHTGIVRLVHRNNPHLDGNAADAISDAMRTAGLTDVLLVERRGAMSYFRATR
ncbi:hypothetical protein BJF78_29160 [Pseudonocardia sp. CNS-139]|nr:hypothetical protein BJF78_29160 [Pseudonocardia sp. CNS-139]